MAILKSGDKAPEKLMQLANLKGSDIKGKKIILYFYPKDDTPGCTAEACDLRDNYATLKNKGFVVFGVSPDSEKSHNKFAEKYNLPFNLIPDTEKELAEAFGVWGEKSMYGKKYMGILRTTFVISENGIIEKVIDKVDTKNHANQILEEMNK
ncbi:MAG: thioredoxin-dependent thiol peroxidase [Bacteroidales bacterium]